MFDGWIHLSWNWKTNRISMIFSIRIICNVLWIEIGGHHHWEDQTLDNIQTLSKVLARAN